MWLFITNIFEENRYKLLKLTCFVVLKSISVSHVLSHPSGTKLSQNIAFLGLTKTQVPWYYPFNKK
jgi:hypothetical protein